MQILHFDIIGTHLEIRIDTGDPIDALTNIIEQRLQNFEKKFSRFIEGNWLHTLNTERQGILDGDGVKMLEKMLDISQKTNGYFDPTISRRLTDLGYGNTNTILQNTSTQDEYGDYRDIRIHNNAVTLQKKIELEFGGIGKGYLLDVLYSELESFNRFLINFGGDLFGRGGWTVGLESPFASDEIIGTIVLDNFFFACSAGTKRKWRNHHHLIDPHTGESASTVIASYIEGKTGMDSDGYATALCVMPWELACETLQKTPEISGVIVSKNGEIYQKNGSKSQIFSE